MSLLCRLGSVASIGRGISTASRVFSQNSLLGLPALMEMTNSPACMCCTQFIRSFSHPTKKYEKSSTALTIVEPSKRKQMNLNKGPRSASTKSRPMPIRTRRMVQIARLVNGLPVPDALQQLRFCNKKEYPLDKVIHNASNLMSIRYGLQPQDLVVKSISVGTAFRKKGIDIRGHGHMGLKIRSYSNVHVIVEEGKPKLSKYGEKRRAAKLEKQARIKRDSFPLFVGKTIQ
ncbi:hypothetical protein WA556_001013 [Blastocystis sp. ATCC 50177/Nand II]